MNVAILQGYIKDNLELRSDNEKAMVCFQIGVPRKYKAGNERTIDYFNIEAQKGLAKWICKTFKQGDFIGVEGKLETNGNSVTLKATEIYFGNYNAEISESVTNGKKFVIKEK